MNTKKIFIAMILFVLGIDLVSASSDILYIGEKIPDIYIRKVSSDGEETVKQGGFLRRKSDNSFVYCVEPFASLKNNFSYSSYEEDYYIHLGIPESTWEKISLIAYYGYQYENHTEDYWYYVTQIMIWREVDKNAEFYFTKTLGSENDPSLFASEIAEIEQLVASHLKLPEFTLEDILYGEEKVFKDKSNVLSNYITDNENVTISNNDLIVRGNTLGTMKINLKRISDNYASVPIVYVDTVGQNVIAVGNLPDIDTSITINVLDNKIRVRKLSEDNMAISEVTFALYDENNLLIDIKKTDELGQILFECVKVGNYILKELEVPNGYVLNNTEHKINLKEYEEITIVNEYQKGSLEVLKVDPNNNPIPATEFTLYDEEKDVLGVYITDDTGKFRVSDLKLGKYFLEETKSNPNYYLLEEVIEFDIANDEEVVTITVTNELIEVDIPDTSINYNIAIFILPNKKNKFGNI